MKGEHSACARRKNFFGEDLMVVNIGIKSFYQELKDQEMKVCHVDWKPPADGDLKVAALLDKLA
ncbi:MAG: fdrA domain protein [Deltaproteobacteria bacterium]|nr:fdrA domain protein [Deltaproteobacteria bacterium]